MQVDPEEFPSAFAVPGEPKRYVAKFSRTFEAVIEAENIVEAQKLARDVVNQFSPGVAKMLSILPEGYVDPDSKPPVGPRSPDAYVHALVLEAFVGPRPKDFEGAHLDGDSTRNVLSNLEWKSAQGNADDRVRHGTTTRGERNPMAQLCERDVLEIRAQAAAGVPRRDIAARLGTRTNNVTRIVARQRWAHI